MQSHFKVILISIFVFIYYCANAAYFSFQPYTITQPDGEIIECYVSGDEYYNWLHDANGFTIVQAQDGYFYYGIENNGNVVPSVYRVNKISPEDAGIKKWAKISYQQYMSKRDFMRISPSKSISGLHTGTLNSIVIYIRFADDSEFTIPRSTYDNKFNLTSAVSLKSYFKEVSYNQLDIISYHYPICSLTTNLSFQDTYDRSYYQPYNATTNPGGYNDDNERELREHTLLVNAVNSVSSQIPSSINIDGDNDGNVDNVSFIIRGNSGAWAELLWAHRWSLSSQTVNINGKRVMDYTFEPENQASVNTLCHEMFHVLGSPDLYHYSQDGFSPVGDWDLMESGSGHMCAFMKWKYTNQNWIADIPEITTQGTYTLHPLSSPTNNAYRIISPNNPDEYFVFEYRKKEGMYETNVPGSGLVIYRINTLAGDGNAGGPPDEVYVYRPNGTLTDNGNISTAFFSLNAGRTSFNYQSNPNCFLSDNSPGDIEIFDITNADTTISFTYGIDYKPTAAFDALPKQSCTGVVEFIDKSSKSPTSWLWDFGDGTTSTLQNPTHEYSTNGYKTVKLKVTNTYGVDSLRMFNFVRIEKPVAPQAIDKSSCVPASLTLEATANTGGVLNWYSQLNGGTLLNTGSTYQTPFLSATTTYYVEEETQPTIQNVGAIDTTIGNGGFFNNSNTHYLVFDCYKDLIIQSVKVYAQTDKDRTIVIKDLNDNILFDTTIYLTTGEHTLNLNASLPIGSNYKMECTTPYALLFRNSSGGSYDYIVSSLIAITDNSASNPAYYYYFYDWKVIGNSSCVSLRKPVTANILIASANFSYTTQNLNASFQNTSLNASTYLWNFGDGNTSTQLNPQHTYASEGYYDVSLIITNSCDTDTVSQQIHVFLNDVQNINSKPLFKAYPNPVKDELTLNFDFQSSITIEILNLYGQKVFSEKINTAEKSMFTVPFFNFPQGVYLLNIKGERDYTQKIIKL